MSTADIKIEIFRKIDSWDSSTLQEFYGVMLNYVNSKMDIDEWVGVTEDEKKEIEAAIVELDAGQGIPHFEVMEKIRNKYYHD